MKRTRGMVLFLVFTLGVFFLSHTVFAEEKTEQKSPQKTEQKAEEQTEQRDQKKAEQKTDRKSSHKLQEITVTDKKTGEPVTSPYAVAESSKLATEVITKEEIEQMHPQTIYDILEYAPGMEIEFQGRRQLNFMNMRGGSSYGIILDGVYIPSLQFQSRILATIPVDAIESVTVVRDATALILGPLTNFGSGNGSSNQGFIVIKTKRSSKLEGGIVASYGSLHTQKEHVYQGNTIKDFDYRLAYTHQETPGKTNWYNASRNDSLYFRGGYTGKYINADMFFYSSRGMRELQRGEIGDGTINDGMLDKSKWKYDPLLSQMIAINLNKQWNERQTTTFGYGHGRMDDDVITADFTKPKVPANSAGESDWAQSFDLRHTINFTNNTLKLGGQLLSWTTSQDMYSIYAYDEHRMFNNKLTIDGGIRADKKYYLESPVTGNDMKEWSKEVYSLAFGAAYKVNSMFTTTGRFAYSENTLAGYQTDTATKTALPAEKRFRYEGGILANVHPMFNPSITLFYYDTKNQKVAGGSYIDPITLEEVDLVTNSDVKTKGLEIAVFGQIMKYLTYNVNYSYATTNDAAANRKMPHHTASARISHRYKGFETNLMVRWVNEYSQMTASPGTFTYDFGDYTRVDANIAYNFKLLGRDTKVMLYGQNLGDVHYTTRYVAGAYKDVGRQYGIQMSYSFF